MKRPTVRKSLRAYDHPSPQDREFPWHPVAGLAGARARRLLDRAKDATKTTVLDAIEWVSLPRSGFQVTDADFHQADPTQPIVIEATFGELPAELLVDPEKFGLCLRGYDAAKGIIDDAVDGAEQVLTVRFEAGADLDPVWGVVKDSMAEPKRIAWQDRERLGVTRLGEDVEKHLTWGRGSALSKLTAKLQPKFRKPDKPDKDQKLHMENSGGRFDPSYSKYPSALLGRRRFRLG